VVATAEALMGDTALATPTNKMGGSAYS